MTIKKRVHTFYTIYKLELLILILNYLNQRVMVVGGNFKYYILYLIYKNVLALFIHTINNVIIIDCK